ncbi:MAG: 5-formyltetrahydrofolate cyclo-ligase [Frankiales bacterium]|nr:5-formyltetrahydrofolate cyclo-ligase [Frankiales bacterium]
MSDGTKTELRARIRATRSARSAADRATVASQLRDVALSIPEVATARTVAAYVGVASEPQTLPLLDALVACGARVLLPLLCADGDLDWAEYAGAHDLVQAPHLLLEPTGPPLGRGEIGVADVIVVPALAVDRDGNRLGQGGGAYDRALVRVAPTALVLALVHDDEILDVIPADPWDRPVLAAATPQGLAFRRQ